MKPLYRQGIDTPILRDNRPNWLNNQILAVFETNLHKRPVYINDCPNYSIALMYMLCCIK